MSNVDVSVRHLLFIDFACVDDCMIAARTARGMVDPGTIKEIEADLAKVIEAFDRAVRFENLRRTTENGEPIIPRDCSFSIVSCRGGGYCEGKAEICRDEL